MCHFPTYLDVLFGDEPRSMGQHSVKFSQVLQSLRGILQAVQPLGVPTNTKEIVDVEVHQVGALMSRRSLKRKQQDYSNYSIKIVKYESFFFIMGKIPN